MAQCNGRWAAAKGCGETGPAARQEGAFGNGNGNGNGDGNGNGIGNGNGNGNDGRASLGRLA